jgi:AraC-like DNA-binding protein
MTDFDLKAEQRQFLSEAIFGGDKPTTTQVRRWVRQADLAWPHAVMSVRLPEAMLSSRKLANLKKLNVKLLSLHAGLLYIFSNETSAKSLAKSIKRLFKLSGQFYPCEHPASWVNSIQQSIIVLRQLELNAVQADPDSPPPSLQEEIDSRRLAVVQVQRHEPHWQKTVNLWLRIVLLRHRNHLHDVRRKIVEFISSITRPADVQAQLSSVFTRSIQRIYATHAFSDFEAVVLDAVMDLSVYLTTQHMQTEAQSPLVRDAIALLHDKASELLSLRDVAEHVHVSSSHLARLFRKQTGMSVTTYLHQFRIALAKRQLIETNDTILSIALDCGFESAEHFHRIFKRHTDMTPRRYRVTHHG